METETLASRNVVEMLMRDVFDAGLCPTRVAEDGESEVTEKGDADAFVYGWDC